MLPGLDCFGTAWTPQIGDPTALGWMIAAGYGFSACLAFAAWRGPVRWALLAVLLLFMVNKQLDLQTALTAVAKCMAQAQGWYEARRPVQIGFAVAVLLAVTLLIRALVKRAWARPAEAGFALAGLICLFGFVGLRAAQVHHLETGPLASLAPGEAIRVFEPIGILLIAGQAGRRLWLRRARPGASKA